MDINDENDEVIRQSESGSKSACMFALDAEWRGLRFWSGSVGDLCVKNSPNLTRDQDHLLHGI